VVFGRRGGVHMAEFAAEASLAPLPEQPAAPTLELLNGLRSRDRAVNPVDIRTELQDEMFDKAFVVRSEQGLKEMEDVLANLRERYAQAGVQDKGAVYNTELMEAVELGFLLDCAETLVASARARTESRGAHYREDHTLRDDANWLKHSLAYRREDGSIELGYKPVRMGPYVPMERKY